MSSTKAVVAGVIAAVLGALLWGAIAAYARLEIGWIALIIGAVIGAVMVGAGASGVKGGTIAAALTVAAICVGKLLAVSWTMGSAVEEMAGDFVTREVYEEMVVDARDLEGVTTEAELKRYLMTHGYSEAATADEVTGADIMAFRLGAEQGLRKFQASPRDYETWRADSIREITALVDAEVGLWDRLQGSMGIMDILFFFLAIGAAFQVVSKQE